MTTSTNNGEQINLELNGIIFNKVNAKGARVGNWIDYGLGMIVFYTGNGDSQVLRAGYTTKIKMQNCLNKMERLGQLKSIQIEQQKIN